MILGIYCLLSIIPAFLFASTMAVSLPLGFDNMFPVCSLDCVATALQSEPPIAQDINLLCRHPRIEKALADCVRGSCSFQDQQKVGKKNFELCKDLPVESKVVMAMIVLGFLGILTNTVVGLRLYTRMKLARGIGYDDHFIMAASAVLAYVQVSGTIDVIAFGLGQHTFNVDPKLHLSNLWIYWSDEIAYQIVITLTKCSIIFFFLRIFPGDRFRLACYGMLALVISTGLGFLLVTILQCKPIRGVFDKSHPSTCLDVNSLTYASGGVSIFLDFTILLMPIPQLYALRVPRKQRNTVLFLFSFGLIASVISIARLPFIVQYGKTTDPLFDNIGPGIWTISEMGSAIIAACLPTLKPLVAKMFPRYFSDENNISNQQQHASPIHDQQQMQHNRAPRGHLSREFNYLFSHTSTHLWAEDVESQRLPSSHVWAEDTESQRPPSTPESEVTQESQETAETQDTEDFLEIYQTNETHVTEQTNDSQDSERHYFDLKDGKIVQLNERFSALSVGFVSRYLEDYWGSMDYYIERGFI